MVGDEAGGSQDLHPPESSVASNLPWVLSGSSPPQDQLRLPSPLVGLLHKIVFDYRVILISPNLQRSGQLK